MGNEQPKKIARVNKDQINVGCLKAKIHLELVRDRKHGEVIKGEKELVAKMHSKSRNKTEEILIAERVVNGLKYAQACNLLMGYAATLRGQGHFIAENMLNAQKMEPYLGMIYSLIFAADHMGLSSLNQFKTLMRALNDPVAVQKYVNPEILAALTPSPTAEELNMYMLEFSERNNIPLEEINIIGHKFTKEWKNIPSVPPVQPVDPQQMDDFERRIAEEFKNKIINPYNTPAANNPANFNPYKQISPNTFNNPNPNYPNPNPNYPNPNPNYPNNNFIGGNNFPPSNNFNGGPSNNPISSPNNNNFIGGGGNGNNQFGSNPYEKGPANLGPNFYVPADIAPKKPEPPTNRTSINSLNDIDYYPDIDVDAPVFNQGGFSDPSFDQICERLKKGL